jgi:hypothetical protein
MIYCQRAYNSAILAAHSELKLNYQEPFVTGYSTFGIMARRQIYLNGDISSEPMAVDPNDGTGRCGSLKVRGNIILSTATLQLELLEYPD